jgi:hypothetical protein
MTSKENLKAIIEEMASREVPEIKVIKLKSTIKNKRKSMF